MSVEKAIEAPKIHHQWFPNKIFYEPDRLSPDTKTLLQNKGHELSKKRILAD